MEAHSTLKTLYTGDAVFCLWSLGVEKEGTLTMTGGDSALGAERERGSTATGRGAGAVRDAGTGKMIGTAAGG